MKKVLLALSLFSVALLGVADTSDYIWNQQFEKKMIKAEAGDLKAQYDVGNMYLKGQGTALDAKEAFKWFKKAAEEGYARAQYKLGYLYHRGEGVRQSHSKGFKWVNKAARQSYKPAMYYVGKLYAAGEGVEKDIKKAIEWQKKSYAAGYNPAKRELERLEARLALEKQREVAFDPRPVRVVKAKPKPKPKAKAKPRPKPKARAVKKVKLSEKAIKEILLANKWQLKDKPAVLLPSSMTSCKQKQGKLTCESKEMEYNESYGVISYTMQVSFSNFNSSGEFSGEYNKNITLIFPDDPDDPDIVIPLEYGPQKKQQMRCKLISNDVVCYRGEKREKVIYHRT